jgi:hypothetical protein
VPNLAKGFHQRFIRDVCHEHIGALFGKQDAGLETDASKAVLAPGLRFIIS